MTFKGILFCTSGGIPNLRIKDCENNMHDVDFLSKVLCFISRNLDKFVVPTSDH